MLYLVYCTLGILLGGYGQIVFSKAIAYDQRQSGDVNVQIHLKDVQIVALVDTDLMDEYTEYDYAYDYADFTLKPIIKPTTTSTTSTPNASTTSTPNASTTSTPNASTTSTPNASTSSIKPWTTWPTNKPSSTSSTTDNSNNDLTVDATKWNSTEASTSTTPTNAQESTFISTTQRASTVESNNVDSTKENNGTLVKLTINNQASNRVIVEEQDFVKNDGEIKMKKEPSLKNNKACPFPYIADKKGRCRSLNHRRRISLVPLTMRLGSRLTKKGHSSLQKDLPIRIFKYDSSQ